MRIKYIFSAAAHCFCLLLICAFSFVQPCRAQQGQVLSDERLRAGAVLKGIITDEDGIPIKSANVFLAKTVAGALTNSKGEFHFTTAKQGAFVLTVTCVGYEKSTQATLVEAGKTLEFTIALRNISTKTGKVVVAASGYSSESGKGVVLSARDIVTTPGGAADIFQAIKTMPGMTQVSESAELFVRGGDPTETITLLDQASLYNPYTFESGFGGLFSNVNTAAVRDLYFTSGGFSAKYGNALSGVLDMTTKDEPTTFRTAIGVSMANASLTSEIPLADGRAGLNINVRKTLTNLLFLVNGGLERFTKLPESHDASIGATWRYSGTGKLKLFASTSGDQSGVFLQQPGYRDEYTGLSGSAFLNAQHTEVFGGRIVVKTSLSYSTSSNEQNIGAVAILRTDKVWKARSDAEIQISSRWKLNAGLEAEQRTTAYTGTLPAQSWNTQSQAAKIPIDAQFVGARFGVYAEVEAAELFGITQLSAVGGVRFDAVPALSMQWCDPRASIGWQINERSSLKLGWGVFHQNPDPRLFARRNEVQNGSQQAASSVPLAAMQAQHVILSYDYTISDNMSIRVEAFNKDYTHLPLQTLLSGAPTYTSAGYGYARGVDMIAKGGFPEWKLSGLVSYGLIDTKRYWLDFERLAPSPYDITHNLTVIAKYEITSELQAGISYRYATGRPYTPVESATLHTFEGVYEPLYGGKNSARLPDYHRLDLRLTYLTQVLERFTVVYMECLNILGIENMFGYTYSRDYAEKIPMTSFFGRRTVVVGFQITL